MSESKPVLWLKASGELPEAVAEDVEEALIGLGLSGIQTINAEFLPPDGVTPPAPGNSRLEFYLSRECPEADTMTDRVRLVWADARERHGLRADAHPLSITPLENDGWETRWRDFFHPTRVGKRLWISPTWEPATPGPGEITLEIDPGMAFGTGAHETTAMLLAALDDLAMHKQLPMRMLDVGTGSGILAIAAYKLGVSLVDAIDNDPIAVEVARENLRLNHVLEDACTPSLTPLEDLQSPYPLVLANIISSVLLELAPHLIRLTEPDGRLWLSGILREEAQDVIDGFVRAGIGYTDRVDSGEWTMLKFRRGPA